MIYLVSKTAKFTQSIDFAVSQSAEKNQTFVKNSFSVVGAEDLSQIDAPMEEKNESGSDLFKW